jgi:hypothetical protein
MELGSTVFNCVYSYNMANPLRPSRLSFTCPKCFLVCKTRGGLTRHDQTVHRDFTPVSDDEDDENRFTSERHPFINGINPIFYLV